MSERDLLKRMVIAWDAEQDDEFSEAITEARALLGFTLDPDADAVLTGLQRQHGDDADDDDSESTR